MAPRTADAAFEAMRHARGCGSHLEAAGFAVQFLRDLLAARVTVDAPRLLGGFFSEAAPHERVLEHKTRVYAELCATVEVIETSLSSAKACIDRMGRASVRVMRDLRVLEHTGDASCCRSVVADLVASYTRHTEQMKQLRETMANVLPNDVAARAASPRLKLGTLA